MTLGTFAADCSMMLARSIHNGRPCGVIVNEHLLSARETRLHVDALGRWFDFIHHDELVDRLSHPRPRPFCLLTFDDGKRQFALQTAPELERLGIPAVLYVTTRFLTDGRPLWFDRHEAITISLGSVPRGLELDVLKQLPLDSIEERLDDVSARHKLALDLSSDDVLPMSWDEARDLARRGFVIGAHGVRHCILPREPEARAVCEIRQSIEEVTSRLGGQCVSFAFPNGNYTPQLARYAVECGVRTVMTTEPLWADTRFPCWRLPRIQLFGRDRPTRIALKLALAATGRVLPNPDGTGRLYRRVDGIGRDDAAGTWPAGLAPRDTSAKRP